MENQAIKVWVSALIPRKGAHTYEGVRIQVSLTEEGCYQDLAGWLDTTYQGIAQTIKLLNRSLEDERVGYGVKLWKVETQEVCR